MRDRIQELVKQANSEIGEQLDQPGVYLNFGPAKHFAELLVKECAKYVEDSNLVGIPRDNIPGGMIRYFGVEE